MRTYPRICIHVHLFKNMRLYIDLDETINISVDELFKSKNRLRNLQKLSSKLFLNLLAKRLCLFLMVPITTSVDCRPVAQCQSTGCCQSTGAQSPDIGRAVPGGRCRSTGARQPNVSRLAPGGPTLVDQRQAARCLAFVIDCCRGVGVCCRLASRGGHQSTCIWG